MLERFPTRSALLFALVPSLAFSFGCSSSSTPPTTSAAPPPVASASAGESTEPLALDPKDTLTVDHGPCFGHCEQIALKLTGDGVFTGRGDAKTLDANTTRELFALAVAAFDPAPTCPPMPTDLQRVTVTLVRHGAEQKAVHVRGVSCSKALDDLEAKVTSIR